jgi:hypothetical protein
MTCRVNTCTDGAIRMKHASRQGETLSLRIPAEVKSALIAASAAEERPITTIILRLLRGYLQDGGYLPSPAPAPPSRPVPGKRRGT